MRLTMGLHHSPVNVNFDRWDAEGTAERNAAAELLHESEERFRTLVANAPVRVAELSMEGRILRVTPGCRGLEYAPVVGSRIFHWLEEEDRDNFREALERARETLEPQHLVITARDRDGKTRWFQTTLAPVAVDGELRSVMLISNDITDKKRAEEEMVSCQDQLRSLSSELILAEERERRAIALAIHDQIGQTLAIAGIKLGVLRDKDLPESLSQSLDQIRDLIKSAISYSRALTYEISPPVLYDIGLEAAIESLAEHFGKDHDIAVRCELDRQPRPLPQNMVILLYQSVRELLVNAVKHSECRTISVSSRWDESSLKINVEDDGVGFDPAAESDWKGNGFGLFSIRERLRYLGGSMEVHSVEGDGTVISLTAPLAAEK